MIFITKKLKQKTKWERGGGGRETGSATAFIVVSYTDGFRCDGSYA